MSRGEGGLFKRGSTWYARLCIQGQDTQRKGGTRQQAKMVLGDMIRERENARLGLPSPTACKTTTGIYYEQRYLPWAKEHVPSWQMYARRWAHLEPVFADIPLLRLTRDAVEQYQRGRVAEGAAPNTINFEIRFLSTIVNHAVRAGVLIRSPIVAACKMLDPGPLRKPILSPDEEAVLLGACNEWLRWAVEVAAGTGLRKGEVCGLQWKHLDATHDRVLAECQLDKAGVRRAPKTSDSRWVPLRPDLLADMLRRRAEVERRLRDEGVLHVAEALAELPIVPNRQGVDWKLSTLDGEWQEAKRAAGRPDLHFHDLRHIFASRLLAAGASLPEVADVLGHRTLAMSKRYAHTDQNRLAGLVAKMPASAEPRAGTVVELGG